MKAVEQQQPNSMDSNDYAYRPLTTTTSGPVSASASASTATSKHRRAGSTGTTGDEEYTTDEDELYADEADCSGTSIHPPHPISKSDLARAATDLFGYAYETAGHRGDNDEPTSLFDEEEEEEADEEDGDDDDDDDDDDNDHDVQFLAKSSSTTDASTATRFLYNGKLSSDSEGVATRQRNLVSTGCPVRNNDQTGVQFSNDNVKPLDVRLVCASARRNRVPRESLRFPRPEASSLRIEIEEEMEKDATASAGAESNERGKAEIAEVNEQALTKLREELKKAQDQLKLRDEEVARLSRFRRDVEQELEELTASLFQEAHNMVREANTRQASAERLLEESRMKAEVLAAEVAALKTLVLTSTPARPNPHLHPQIDARCCSGNLEDTQGSLLFPKKQHGRSPSSHLNRKYGREEHSPPGSPVKEPENPLPSQHSVSAIADDDNASAAAGTTATATIELVRDRREHVAERSGTGLDGERQSHLDYRDKESKDFALQVDPRVHAQFLRWKTNPCLDRSDPFVARVFHEDIDLCLDFPNPELGTKVRQAVLDGIIFIEAVSEKNKLAFPKKCALLEAPRQCHYRMRLSDQENQWHSISQLCRNRIIAVCDFLNYLRYVERGLVKSSVHDIYWEITRLRKEMVFARLGLALSP